MKGMRKIKRGSDFKGVVLYAFGTSQKRAGEPGKLLGGTFGASTSPAYLINQFERAANGRSNIKKPVWHNAIRLPASERIDEGIWVDIGDEYMRRMGFEDQHLRIYVLHDDGDGQHIHIVASRVGKFGSLYTGANENLKSTKIISALEKEYGLKLTKEVDLHEDGSIVMPELKGLKKGEIEKAIREETRPPKLVMQEAVSAAMKGKPTMLQFMQRIEAAGVTVIPNISPGTGKFNGFAFSYDGQRCKSSELGAKFSLAKLLKGIDYVETRDRQELANRALDNASGTDDERIAADAVGAAETNRGVGSGDRAARKGPGETHPTPGRDGSAHPNGRSSAASTQEREASNLSGASEPGDAVRADTGKAIATIHRLAWQELNRRHAVRRMRELEEQEENDRLARIAARSRAPARMINPERTTWRRWREELLEKEYGTSSSFLATFFIKPRRRPQREVVYEKKYARIVDKGPLITAAEGNREEIRAMLELARLKRWSAVQFKGTIEFRRAAMKAALLDGFKVQTKTAEDAALLQSFRDDLTPVNDSRQRVRTLAPSTLRR